MLQCLSQTQAGVEYPVKRAPCWALVHADCVSIATLSKRRLMNAGDTYAEWQGVEISAPEWTTEPTETGQGEFQTAITARSCCSSKGENLEATCTNTIEEEIKKENSLTSTSTNTFEAGTTISAGVSALMTAVCMAQRSRPCRARVSPVSCMCARLSHQFSIKSL